MLDVVQLHCCISFSSAEESTAAVFRCMCDVYYSHIKEGYCLRLPKTSNADVRNQGGGTISDVSHLHHWLLFLNAAPHPSQVAGILSKGCWYLIASASQNSVADQSK